MKKYINLKMATALAIASIALLGLTGCQTTHAEPRQWSIVRDVGDGKCRIIETDGGFAVSGVLDEQASNAKQIVDMHNRK
jgi:hypothetical protein